MLIRGMLTKDPDLRYNFDKIRNHPFLRRARKPKPHLRTEINITVINQMESLGFVPAEVIEMLGRNKHNSQTATYYLLLQKHSRAIQPLGMQKVLDLFGRRKGRDLIVKRQ